jgi:hypothetical protein
MRIAARTAGFDIKFRRSQKGELMKSRLLMVLIAVFACTCVFQAQTPDPNPLSTEAKNAFNRVKGYLMKAAANMPEENYSFKPTPEMRSFGELLAHISDSAIAGCSRVNGAEKKGDAATIKTKSDLVAALGASFAECDTAYSSLTDAMAAQLLKNNRTKLGTLVGNTTHLNESYGYLAVYFRLKGLVPPSSEK